MKTRTRVFGSLRFRRFSLFAAAVPQAAAAIADAIGGCRRPLLPSRGQLLPPRSTLCSWIMTTCAALARFAWCLNRGGCTQLFIACAPSPLRRGRQASNQLRRCKRPECASARWSGQWLLAWRRPWSSSGALRSACLLILSVAGPYQRLATYSMYHDKQLFSFDHHPSASGAAATSGGRRREPRTGGRRTCEASPVKRYTPRTLDPHF